MSTAKELLTFAQKFVGYTEAPPGSNMNKFGAAYGMNGVPWCAEFTWFCLSQMHVPIIKSAYTPTVAQWFKDQKRGFVDDSKVEPGDVLFFNFPDSVDRIQHIAFALGVPTSGRIRTVEGNTSSAAGGSEDNGGTVARRDRGFAEIVYIGRPDYDTVKALPRFEVPKHRTFLRIGDKGADVRTLQFDLNRWMAFLRKNKKGLDFDFGRIDVDGIFDGETKKALQTFQAQHPKIEPDGLFGRETERVLEAVRERQRGAA